MPSGTTMKASSCRDHPPRWCEGHHIRFWADGGPTSLSNGVLLCGYHHRLVHVGDWRISMGDDGHPLVHPPPWIGPHRRPLRNTAHQRLGHGGRWQLIGGRSP